MGAIIVKSKCSTLDAPGTLYRMQSGGWRWGRAGWRAGWLAVMMMMMMPLLLAAGWPRVGDSKKDEQ